MAIEKRPSAQIIGKRVVTKEGKNMGIVKDINFETRTGELIQILIGSATAHAQTLNVERSKNGELLIPYSAILAIGDFVVVSEEEMK